MWSCSLGVDFASVLFDFQTGGIKKIKKVKTQNMVILFFVLSQALQSFNPFFMQFSLGTKK